MGEDLLPAQLVIDCDDDQTTMVLKLRGELDLASSPLLEDALSVAEGAEGGCLVIDLSRLEFMDSAGLRVLLGAQTRSLQNGHQLSLRKGPRSVQRLLELTGTTAQFRYES